MMERQYFTLSTPLARTNCARALADAPDGTRVQITGAKRTLPQNARMWAMLTDIAAQKEHCGRRYTTDEWKVLFLHGLGRETRFIPSLDGQGFIPIGQSSSDLSTTEMSDLIEFMFAWGAEKGVEFHDPPPKAWRREDEAA